MDRGKCTRPRGNAASGRFHVAQDPPNGPLLIFSRVKKKTPQVIRQPVLMLGLIGVDVTTTFVNVCKTMRRLGDVR